MAATVDAAAGPIGLPLSCRIAPAIVQQLEAGSFHVQWGHAGSTINCYMAPLTVLDMQ